ncbi:MAG: ABC transporter substrate-binding protein [Catalinimonas sp.]
MYTRPLLWLLLLSWPLASARGQTRDDETKYLYGKELLRKEQFAEAVRTFEPLAVADANNRLAAYAHYFLGLAQYRTGRHDDANRTLTRLAESFPRWSEITEAYYLLGLTSLARDQPELGFQYLGRVRSSSLRALADRAKRSYLAQADDLATLEALHKANADDQAVTRAYARRLSEAPPTAANRKALADLLARLPAAERDQLGGSARRKDRYRVAVLLPFEHLKLDPTNARRDNQFVIDLYEGIHLAAEALRNEAGEPLLDLYVYDTERSAARARRLADLPELRSMDLLVGPIYSEPSLELAKLARERRVPMVNPLATNPAIVADNPFALLAETTPAGQGQAAARFASGKFSPNTAIIFSGPTARDSAMAAAYTAAFTAAGGRVLDREEVGRVGAGETIRGLLSNYPAKEVGHLFCTSSDAGVAAAVVTTLELLGRQTPVVAPGDWLLDASMVSFEQWERRGVYFMFPNYVDADREAVREFRRTYLNRVDLVPSVYAYQGYDLMHFLGEMLREHGPAFAGKLKKVGFRAGRTLGGYDYSGGQDNGFVPMLMIEKGQPRVVNLPSAPGDFGGKE